MLLVLAGLSLGVAVALLEPPVITAFADRTADALVSASADALGSLLKLVPSWPDDSLLVQTVALTVALCLPGLVALTLTLGARASRSWTRSLSGLLVLGALASFFVLPASSTFVLVGLAALGSALLAITRPGTTIALAALAGLITTRAAAQLWSGPSESISSAAGQLAELVGAPASGDLFRVLLAIVVAAPLLAVPAAALSDRRPARPRAENGSRT